MKRVIVLAGPTASGKTALSIELARRYNGEIVSADSMQIYKEMDIGTAKPSKEEMQGIPHHMIDVVSPLEAFNVVKYKEMATAHIDDILKRGKTPIVCGGTGLYINSLLYNINYVEQNLSNEPYRQKLINEMAELGNGQLYNRLMQIDPEAAKNIHPNNLKRIIRALEVYEMTGKRFSEGIDESMKNPPQYDFVCLYLNMDRDYLYERINKRVEIMITEGLIEETAKLYKKGLLEGMTASMGICYKEMLPYVLKESEEDGEALLEKCVERLKQSTRNYAKRQITWFKKTKGMNFIDIGRETTKDEVLLHINFIITS